MPKSYLNSQPPPNQLIEDWLTWTRASFERFISNDSSKIAGIMGINKVGDIQSLYMPFLYPRPLPMRLMLPPSSGMYSTCTASHRLFLPTHPTSDQLLPLRPLPKYHARFALRNLSNLGFLLIWHGQRRWHQLGWLSSQPLHQFSSGKLLSKATFTIL